jgi:hypothetical protein
MKWDCRMWANRGRCGGMNGGCRGLSTCLCWQVTRHKKSVHPGPLWLPKTTPTLASLACIHSPSSFLYLHLPVIQFSANPPPPHPRHFLPSAQLMCPSPRSANGSLLQPSPACRIVYMGFNCFAREREREVGCRLAFSSSSRRGGHKKVKRENPAWI